EALAQQALGRAGGGVGAAVVGDAVGGDGDGGVGLGDLVADGAAGVVVVAGGVGEGPGVGGVRDGAGVRGAAQVQAAQAHATHPLSRAGGGVGGAVVGDAVGRDGDQGVGLGDLVVDGAAGVV